MYTDTKVANATPKVPILSTNTNKEIIENANILMNSKMQYCQRDKTVQETWDI